MTTSQHLIRSCWKLLMKTNDFPAVGAFTLSAFESVCARPGGPPTHPPTHYQQQQEALDTLPQLYIYLTFSAKFTKIRFVVHFFFFSNRNHLTNLAHLTHLFNELWFLIILFYEGQKSEVNFLKKNIVSEIGGAWSEVSSWLDTSCKGAGSHHPT